ncbi:MAG TPA: endonuclease/exonuclease/phosphatase family protein [Actinomycetes bacterium]|nr:endonuclease/exonuclease/phosphatase family protein [Actinomycetes bacterium]
MTGLRLVSWNIRSLRDDAAMVARVLRHLEPDVVCLQEVPRFLGGSRALRRMTSQAGLDVLVHRRPARPLAVLGRPGITAGRSVAVRLTYTPRLHRRSFVATEVNVPDRPRVVVGSMHLGLHEDERSRHVPEVLTALADLGPGRRILAGDVNARPGDPPWRALVASGLVDAGAAEGVPTSTAANPHQRIDAVFVGPGLRVLTCRPPAGIADLHRASDHLPLVCDLEYA